MIVSTGCLEWDRPQTWTGLLDRRVRTSPPRITEPSTEQKRLLQELKFSIPERLNFGLKCSENSAIA
jgi:hypothetical protein